MTTEGKVLSSHDESLSESILLERKQDARKENKKQNKLKKKINQEAAQHVFLEKAVFESSSDDDGNSHDRTINNLSDEEDFLE